VVLVHGFPQSSEVWTDFSKELSKECTVITPDLPGHGLSGLPQGLSSMEEYADAVHTVVSHSGIKQFTLIGHSMGGYISLAFAKKYQGENLLNGIGLFHSTVFADSDEKKAGRNRSMEAVKKDRAGFNAELIPNLFAKENHERCAEGINILKKIAQQTSAESMVASLTAMRDRTDTSDFAKETTLPFLFIIGKKDNSVPFDKNFPMTSFPKKAITLLLDNVAHSGFYEAKEETLFAIRNFLKFCNNDFK
jgi:pimeloyl-ACP methyl ester carboxylesterase